MLDVVHAFDRQASGESNPNQCIHKRCIPIHEWKFNPPVAPVGKVICPSFSPMESSQLIRRGLNHSGLSVKGTVTHNTDFFSFVSVQSIMKFHFLFQLCGVLR